MATDAPLQVVIVEDDDDTRELLILALELAGGFVAHGAGSLAEARQVIGSVRADAIVADYTLPDGNGTAVVSMCVEAQASVRILLTGFDARDVESTGFDVVLTKPVMPDVLIATIRARVASR